MACGICSFRYTEATEAQEGEYLRLLGHGASGIVARAGSDVRDWKAETGLHFDSTVYPLNDWFTLKGKYNLSDNGKCWEFLPEHTDQRLLQNM